MNKYPAKFICGMSRGGTTWMGKCLNEHPEAAVFGESCYWGRAYLSPANGHNYDEEDLAKVIKNLKGGAYAFIGDGPGCLNRIDAQTWNDGVASFSGKSPITPAELFASLCEWVKEEERVGCVVEKTPHHVDWIGRILKSLPQSKFVVMSRDPYGFMLSYKHLGDRKNKRVKNQFKAIYHPIGCAYVWRRYMRSIRTALVDYPEACLLVDFRDLQESPSVEWNRVLGFFQISSIPLPESLDRNSSFGKEQKALSHIDVFWMNRIAGKTMIMQGYETKRSNVSFLELVKSVCGIPIWLFRFFRHMRVKTSGGLFRYIFNTKG